MIETREIHGIKDCPKGRKSWRCSNGNLGTVEEIAREYYVNERGFKDCLIDSSCVYGGLLWIIFHEILFHDSLNSRQPLCAQFFHKAPRFYDIHEREIEERLAEYQSNRAHIFDRQMQRFLTHPFFCDPTSKISKHSGSWVRRNESALREFVTMSAEHNQEALIREILITSHFGQNAGWPDLVAWNDKSIVLAEVKFQDELSLEQCRWITDHKGSFQIELVRVVEIQ